MSNISPKAKIYAILADSVYWDVKEYNAKIGDKLSPNWIPVPSDWTLIKEVSKSGDGISNLANSLFSGFSGFTARAYKDANTTYVH